MKLMTLGKRKAAESIPQVQMMEVDQPELGLDDLMQIGQSEEEPVKKRKEKRLRKKKITELTVPL